MLRRIEKLHKQEFVLSWLHVMPKDSASFLKVIVRFGTNGETKNRQLDSTLVKEMTTAG